MTIFLRGDGISSNYSESLALLRRDLGTEPWETQLLEGCPWVWVRVCVPTADAPQDSWLDSNDSGVSIENKCAPAPSVTMVSVSFQRRGSDYLNINTF